MVMRVTVVPDGKWGTNVISLPHLPWEPPARHSVPERDETAPRGMPPRQPSQKRRKEVHVDDVINAIRAELRDFGNE